MQPMAKSTKKPRSHAYRFEPSAAVPTPTPPRVQVEPLTRTARIRPGWEQFWKDTASRLNTTPPKLGSLVDGAIVRLVDGSDTYHEIDGHYVDIVGKDGKTASANFDWLEVIEDDHAAGK
jgi:hypothetical protein